MVRRLLVLATLAVGALAAGVVAIAGSRAGGVWHEQREDSHGA